MTGENAPFTDTRFETERLQVKPWQTMFQDPQTRSGSKAAIKALLTPSVTQFLPEPMQLDAGSGALEAWISARNKESDVLCVRDKRNDHFLGLLILAAFPETEKSVTVRLGYFLVEKAWGQGLATELLKGLVHYCLDQRQSFELLGGVEKANGASASVLVKAGFSLVPQQSNEQSETYQLIT